jgi:hypothetical protein
MNGKGIPAKSFLKDKPGKRGMTNFVTGKVNGTNTVQSNGWRIRHRIMSAGE